MKLLRLKEDVFVVIEEGRINLRDFACYAMLIIAKKGQTKFKFYGVMRLTSTTFKNHGER